MILALLLVANLSHASSPTDRPEAAAVVHTTVTGAAYTLDLASPALGEAYRDPRGLTWGDAIETADGHPAALTNKEAVEACAVENARLPTVNELRQLSKDLGSRPGAPMDTWGNFEGYSVDTADGNSLVLPHSGVSFQAARESDTSNDAFLYLATGAIGVVWRDDGAHFPARCVR